MQEGTYTPPLYQDLYNFHDGAQNDIFENSTDTGPSSALPASTARGYSNPRDETHAKKQALRRAWGAHHRRSVGKHHS
jgi:hypothetical protein